MDVWTRLARTLGAAPPHTLATPAGRRVGGALVLLSELLGDALSDAAGGDLEIVYTRRHDDLANHPGQVSFPGGRVEGSETVEQAAVREAVEEVALDPASVEVLGRLSPFYIPPSRFWLVPVVARWRAPHPLAPAEAEVAEVLRVSLSTLRDEQAWRVVRLSTIGETWAWQLDEHHLLWGATAHVTGVLLDIVDPSWHGGAGPGNLGRDREVRPWEASVGDVPRRGRSLLPGTVERPVASARAHVANGSGPPSPSRVRAAGRAVTEAVSRLLGHTVAGARVLVLAGGGGTAAAGLRAADGLVEAGADVRVVLAQPAERLRPVAAAAMAELVDRASVFDGALPPADVIVDALVGTGLSGRLAREALAVVLALRHLDAPIVSVDTPSGLDPLAGLVGECVRADVTLALGVVRPGLFHPGLGPFVGDLYLADLDEGDHRERLMRLVADAPPGGRQE